MKNTLADTLFRTQRDSESAEQPLDGREQALARRVRHDREAFLALYELYFRRVYTFACYRCADSAAAEDLTSAVFHAALERVQHYDPERAPFGAWLFGIARNLVGKHLRAGGRQTVPLEAVAGRAVEPAQSPEKQVERREQSNELMALLEELNERERDVISLKFGAQLTNRQIARLAGMSESNVGVTVYRALRKLRRGMQEE